MAVGTHSAHAGLLAVGRTVRPLDHVEKHGGTRDANADSLLSKFKASYFSSLSFCFLRQKKKELKITTPNRALMEINQTTCAKYPMQCLIHTRYSINDNHPLTFLLEQH